MSSKLRLKSTQVENLSLTIFKTQLKALEDQANFNFYFISSKVG